jgi:hypothetical protein
MCYASVEGKKIAKYVYMLDCIDKEVGGDHPPAHCTGTKMASSVHQPIDFRKFYQWE